MSRSSSALPNPAGSLDRRTSGSSHRETAMGSSYRLSEWTPSATSTISPSKHTKPRQYLNSPQSEQNERVSREVTSHRVWWSLNFSSSAESQAYDSERVIAELRREISDLRKKARGKSPAKERPRRKPGKNNRESSGQSFSAHTEAWEETPSRTEKVPSSAYPSSSVRVVKEKQKRSNEGVSERRDKDNLPPKIPKKKARRGEQGAVWKALDLVSSSPFSEENRAC
uniref:Uncharacterized protein n=1 Tax=Fagus sylvatica TaxID=28930 RepID=A0A2N9IJA4_FAGSY